MARPHAWERSYPPGVRWDGPIVPSTLPALFDRAVAAHGPRTAIEFRGRAISFEELGQRVHRTAAALLRDGVGPGASLALYLPNTPYHPRRLLRRRQGGARLAHLSPLDAERELAHKLKDSGARVLVTTNSALCCRWP
jgi:long-chain acyl-CoA synthetase